jgi:hypothetical protein
MRTDSNYREETMLKEAQARAANRAKKDAEKQVRKAYDAKVAAPAPAALSKPPAVPAPKAPKPAPKAPKPAPKAAKLPVADPGVQAAIQRIKTRVAGKPTAAPAVAAPALKKPASPSAIAKIKLAKSKPPKSVYDSVRAGINANIGNLPAKAAQVVQIRRMSAITPRAVHFAQTRHGDGTFEVGTNPLSIYRKASRVVPWVNRASEAAGDLGDIAAGKKPKDPFYKKSWFKRTVQTAAIAAPVGAYALTLKQRGRAARGEAPIPGLAGKIANRGDKVLKKFNLQAITPRAKHFAQKEEKLKGHFRRNWGKYALGAGVVGANVLAARSLAKDYRKLSRGVPSQKKAGHSRATHGFANAVGDAAEKILVGRTVKKMSALTPRAKHFAYNGDALEKGWDLRDARGRSARVYAPGSRRRERREKEWGEKTDNIRLVRNVAIAGTAAGLAGSALLARKGKADARTLKSQYRAKVRKAGGPRMPSKPVPVVDTVRVPVLPPQRKIKLPGREPGSNVTAFPTQKRA